MCESSIWARYPDGRTDPPASSLTRNRREERVSLP